MLIGDYVFLMVISCSVYMVATRLVELLRGKLQVADKSNTEMDRGTAGADR